VGLLYQQQQISEHVASFTKSPSHQSFGCCMPSPSDLQYMLGGKLSVPHFQLTRPVLLRRTGSLAHLWPVAVPRHYHLRARNNRSGTAAATRSSGQAQTLEPLGPPSSPWPRAIRLGKSSQKMKSKNMVKDKIKTEPATQIREDNTINSLTKINAPRATRMWPSHGNRRKELAKTKKEAMEQMIH